MFITVHTSQDSTVMFDAVCTAADAAAPPALPPCCRRGRKTAGIAYAVIYSLSCVTKHSPRFEVLLAGRVLGGIATSLLYSAFESWLVAEHFKHGFSGECECGQAATSSNGWSKVCLLILNKVLL
eukprot:GHRQ01035246.1.p2 GENE.GHRQ01035246.1~~GHRQ01035246.1.p2  ORF type:complete len:125 (-),score=36.98 GHRQ01035246.1:154-528(-)